MCSAPKDDNGTLNLTVKRKQETMHKLTSMITKINNMHLAKKRKKLIFKIKEELESCQVKVKKLESLREQKPI